MSRTNADKALEMKRFRFETYDGLMGDVDVEAISEEEAYPKFWKLYAEEREEWIKDRTKWVEDFSVDEHPPERPKVTVRVVGDPALRHGPLPTCCEKIGEMDEYSGREHRWIRLEVYRYDGISDKRPLDPHWRLVSASLEITYCPHCGTKLPEVELLENPPQPMWTDGDDYCDTCGERNMNCGCNPPWAGYRIKGGS